MSLDRSSRKTASTSDFPAKVRFRTALHGVGRTDGGLWLRAHKRYTTLPFAAPFMLNKQEMGLQGLRDTCGERTICYFALTSE